MIFERRDTRMKADSGLTVNVLNKMIQDGKNGEVIEALRAESKDDKKYLVNQRDSYNDKNALLSCLSETVSKENVSMRLIRFLVVECGADVDAPDSVYTVTEVPLSTAIERGLETVALGLIDYGATVGHTERSKCIEPIMAACSTGNIKIVKYLISLGASVTGLHGGKAMSQYPETDPEFALMTFLMQSVNYPDVCEYLLEKGMDIEEEDKNRLTALHHAAIEGTQQSMDLLLDRGANYRWDGDRQTDVILILAAYGHVSLMEHFISRTDHTQEQIANAYELVGAYICNYEQIFNEIEDEDCDYDLCVRWWVKAMKLRYNDPDQPIRKMLPLNSKIVFSEYKEPETLEELQAIEWNHRIYNIQRLLIVERIIGYNNSLFIEAVADFDANIYWEALEGISDDDHIRCMTFCLRSIKDDFQLILKHGSSISSCISHVMEKVKISPNLILDLIPLVTELIEIFFNQSQKPETMALHSNKWTDLALDAIRFCIYVQHNIRESDSLDSRYLESRKLIHEFGEKVIRRINRGFCERIKLIDTLAKRSFPFEDVAFILRYGQELNYRDPDGNNALLKLVKSFKVKDRHFIKSVALINMFLEHGAHVDMCDAVGDTFFDRLPENLVPLYEDLHKMKPLQCLAARVITDNYLDYCGSIPGHLAEFIDMHKPLRKLHTYSIY